MWQFDSDNQMYSEVRTFATALGSLDCLGTYERAPMVALAARMATSICLTGYEVGEFLVSVQKLMTRKHGSND